jgi:hypothetical protein
MSESGGMVKKKPLSWKDVSSCSIYKQLLYIKEVVDG